MNSVDFYGHSDPDMLEVGNLDKNNPYVEAETRSHFALWAAMKSPLLIGTDLSKLSRHDLAVLANPFLLAFNQDPEYGRPAEPFKWGTNPDWTFDKERPAEFWAGQSRIGTLVLVLNTDDARAIKTVLFEDVPRLDRNTLYSVTDVWTGREMGCITSGVAFEIGAHDTAAIILQENGC
jgi:alpha-galactosidase